MAAQVTKSECANFYQSYSVCEFYFSFVKVLLTIAIFCCTSIAGLFGLKYTQDNEDFTQSLISSSGSYENPHSHNGPFEPYTPSNAAAGYSSSAPDYGVEQYQQPAV